MMKIAFALDDTLDVSDGVQQSVITVGEKLRSMGHDVHYIASETTRNDLKNVHSLAKTLKVAFNGNVMRIPKPANNRRIKELLEREKFDVIHVQMPYSPLFIEKVILNSPADTKLIGTFHILPYSAISKYATSALGRVLRRSIKKLDVIVAVSDPAKVFCDKAFGVSSVVIPNPVDVFKYEGAKKTKTSMNKIIFLGRLVPRKGARELILAYRQLLVQHPELISKTELIIGGKGEQEKSLKKLSKKLLPDANIKFIGYVDEKNKPSLLASADIAIFPSLSGESFGIVLIEAMAAGSKLILAGDNPGYSSVMQNFPDLLISPKRTKQFADKMYEFLQDNKANSELSQKLHKEVSAYDVSVICKSLLVLYNS